MVRRADRGAGPCGPLNDIADAIALAERLGLTPVSRSTTNDARGPCDRSPTRSVSAPHPRPTGRRRRGSANSRDAADLTKHTFRIRWQSGWCTDTDTKGHHGVLGSAQGEDHRTERAAQDKDGSVQKQGVCERQHGDVRADCGRRRQHRPLRTTEDSGADHEQRPSVGVPEGRASREVRLVLQQARIRFRLRQGRSHRHDRQVEVEARSARAVIQIGIIIGGADGHFDDHEKAAVRGAAHAVGIDPAEFDL